MLTFDENTDLEWLDLTATTHLSFDDVIAGAGGFTTTLGFRYATFAEVKSLFATAGIVNISGTPASTDSDSVFENLTDLQSLIGVTALSSGVDPFWVSSGIHLLTSGSTLPGVQTWHAISGGPAI